MIFDLQFAFRLLRRAPGFFLLATLTLGLGIAANTSIFSLFYQVLLRSLPVPEPQRLVVLHSDAASLPGSMSSDNQETVFSYPLYARVRDSAHSFQGVVARSRNTVQIGLEGGAERGIAEVVSGNFFEVLGLRPQLGRLLGSADDTVRGGNPVAVVSYEFWVRKLGASPAVLNQKITLNGQSFTVVGVTPAEFHGVLSGERPDLFVPISMKGALVPGWNYWDSPTMQWLNVIGRLRPGIARSQAQAELAPLYANLLREHIDRASVRNAAARNRLMANRLELRPAAQGLNQLEHEWRKPLLVLLSMVLLLLLIGCANLANLLMARAVNRAREIAIRLALGAGRWRLARLLLSESLLLALAGTLLGLLLTPVLIRGLLRLLPEGAEGGWLSPGLNLPLIAFSALVMLAVTFLFGLAPSIQATRQKSYALAERTASSGGAHPAARKALVAAQIALSLVLLAGAGLFGRSLVNLMQHKPGFRPDHLLTFSVDPGLAGYDVQRGFHFYRDLTHRLAALPGVDSVSFAEAGPLMHSESMSNVMVEGFTRKEDDEMVCDRNSVAAGYFQTLGTPLMAGREFEERDTAGAPRVAVVNEAFVRRFLADRNPVGKHMSIGEGGPLDLEIVGVVADSKNLTLRENVKATFYIAYEQSFPPPTPRIRRATFFVRAAAAFESLPGAVRSTVAQLDAALPVFALRPMEIQVQDSVYTDRLVAALATAFGVLAMILTAVGLYGVIAYLVSRRRAEIGIRMALGATRGQIVSLVMREVAVVTAFGTLVGLLGAFAAGSAIEAQLFGVRGFDPIVFTLVPAVLAAVALLAGSLPSLRASRIEPLEALRYD